MTDRKTNLYLIGFMGAGKSATADALHLDHKMPIIEMDAAIVEREGMPISEIFAVKGEAYFRQVEAELIREIGQKTNQVVSCGGGVVMRDENVKCMKQNGRIVLLTASPETILERVGGNNDRPLLQGRKNVEGIRELMEARKPYYEKAADLVIATDGKTTEEVVTELLQMVR